MKIHLVASLPHYEEHARAVWQHLPTSMRGEARTGKFAGDRELGKPEDLVIVAGYWDIDRVRDHRMIYVEHGAGQKYIPTPGRANKGYHDSQHPESVIGYIAPRQDIADAWGRPAFAAGSPVCDPFPLFGEPNVLAITFHFNAFKVCPEATSALDHYVEDLASLVHRWRSQGFEVLGHKHPRVGVRLSTIWKNLKVREADVAEVRQRASILIADNTSLAYEMMYLGRNVVSLNAPWYRREVNHGLRFWDHVPGTAVDDPKQLAELDLSNLANWKAEIPTYVYGNALNTGMDSIRAASWLTTFAYSI